MGRFNRSACAVAAAIALACGGKTEILDEGIATGSGASGGAAGGSSGATTGSSGATTGRGGSPGAGGSAGISGAAGSGASTGSSGSTGQSGSTGRGGSAGIPGVGGSAGMAGGSGGVTTGGAGGVAGGSTEQTIDAICTHFDRSGCGYQGCRQSLKQSVDTYDLWGCGAAWLESRACVLRDPTPCGGSEFCSDAQARFQKCITDAEICVRGNPPEGGCVMGCEGWGAECKPGPVGLNCVCTSGRNSGSQFLTPTQCQSEEWLQGIRSMCQ